MLTLYKVILIIYDSIIIKKRYCTVEYANYPTLGELLRQDIFSNSQVLSGEAALDIPVAGVNLTDTPDYYDWVSPHELLVTNCYAICGVRIHWTPCGKGGGGCMYQALTVSRNNSRIHNLGGKRAEVSFDRTAAYDPVRRYHQGGL